MRHQGFFALRRAAVEDLLQAPIRTVVGGWFILRILEILKKEPKDVEGIRPD